MHWGPPEVFFFFFRDCPTEIACVNTHFWCILKDWSSSCQLPIVWMMSSCTCEDRAANHPEISQQPRQYHVSCPPACPTLHIISRSENVFCCALHVKNGQLWTPSKPESHPSPGVHAWKLIQAWLIHILVITSNYFAVVQVVVACQDMLQEVSKGREEEGRWARCNHTPVVV